MPHISQRDQIYTLYPEKKQFASLSFCGKKECDWLRWEGNPEYLFIDTSPEWDIRHLLANREDFINGLKNGEKAGIIKKHQQLNSAIIYKIIKNPNKK